MKTIQIPMNSNPFTVIINNSVYHYKAGETIEVPDDVAAAIEDALKLEPKPKRYLSKFAQLVEGKNTELSASDLDGIEAISRYAFYECDNLKRIEIPDSVKRIGHSAFRNCSFLDSVEIPKSTSTIDERAFESCASLRRVIVKALTPPSIQTDSFKDAPASCTFEVYPDVVEAYKTAEYWSAFANQIVAIEE